MEDAELEPTPPLRHQLPTPKFAVGDKVYCSSLVDSTERIQCPDCLDTGNWTVTSPAGYTSTVKCPRCDGRGISMRSYRAVAHEYTIGSIKINTSPYQGDEMVSYMCEETGVGSGTVWPESRLFDNYNDALADGLLREAKAKAELEKGQEGERRAEMRYLSAYQLKDAMVQAAEKEARQANYRLDSLRRRICELLDDTTTCLYIDESFSDDENRPKDMPSGEFRYYPFDASQVARHSLAEFLLSGYDSKENQKFLIEYRAEKAKCRCD